MIKRLYVILPALLFIACSALPARADETLKPFAGREWIAFSTTAMAITGDILIKDDTITFDGWATFRLRHAGEMQPEVSEAIWGGRPVFQLYELADPRLVEFKYGNRLCGSPGDVPVVLARYIAMATTDTRLFGLNLHVGIFSGKPQKLDTDDPTFCGTFGYAAE